MKKGLIFLQDEEGKIAYFKKQMIIEIKKEAKVTKEEKQKEVKDAFEEAKGDAKVEAPKAQAKPEEVKKEGEK